MGDPTCCVHYWTRSFAEKAKPRDRKREVDAQREANQNPTPKIASRKATRRKSKKLRKVEGRRVGC